MVFSNAEDRGKGQISLAGVLEAVCPELSALTWREDWFRFARERKQARQEWQLNHLYYPLYGRRHESPAMHCCECGYTTGHTPDCGQMFNPRQILSENVASRNEQQEAMIEEAGIRGESICLNPMYVATAKQHTHTFVPLSL